MYSATFSISFIASSPGKPSDTASTFSASGGPASGHGVCQCRGAWILETCNMSYFSKFYALSAVYLGLASSVSARADNKHAQRRNAAVERRRDGEFQRAPLPGAARRSSGASRQGEPVARCAPPCISPGEYLRY